MVEKYSNDDFEALLAKYDYSFKSKIYICKQNSPINRYYSKIRNKFFEYKGVTSIITWSQDCFYLDGYLLARIKINKNNPLSSLGKSCR